MHRVHLRRQAAAAALRRPSTSTFTSLSTSPPFAASGASPSPSPPLTLSEVAGPTHPPLISKTLPAYFRDDILTAHAARPALIARKEPARAHGGPRGRNFDDAAHLAWDFGEFDRHIQALARGLLDLGVRRGDRVGVIMGNNRCVGGLHAVCSALPVVLGTPLSLVSGTMFASRDRHDSHG